MRAGWPILACIATLAGLPVAHAAVTVEGVGLDLAPFAAGEGRLMWFEATIPCADLLREEAEPNPFDPQGHTTWVGFAQPRVRSLHDWGFSSTGHAAAPWEACAADPAGSQRLPFALRLETHPWTPAGTYETWVAAHFVKTDVQALGPNPQGEILLPLVVAPTLSKRMADAWITSDGLGGTRIEGMAEVVANVPVRLWLEQDAPASATCDGAAVPDGALVEGFLAAEEGQPPPRLGWARFRFSAELPPIRLAEPHAACYVERSLPLRVVAGPVAEGSAAPIVVWQGVLEVSGLWHPATAGWGEEPARSAPAPGAALAVLLLALALRRRP